MNAAHTLDLGRLLDQQSKIERTALERHLASMPPELLLEQISYLSGAMDAHAAECSAKLRPCASEVAIMAAITFLKEILARRLLHAGPKEGA